MPISLSLLKILVRAFNKGVRGVALRKIANQDPIRNAEKNVPFKASTENPIAFPFAYDLFSHKFRVSSGLS